MTWWFRGLAGWGDAPTLAADGSRPGRACLAAALAAMVGLASATESAQAPAAPQAATVQEEVQDKLPSTWSLQAGWRSFMDRQVVEGLVSRKAWTLGARIKVESPWTPGPVRLGMAAELFAAANPVTSPEAGNMAHTQPDGTALPARAWAYAGAYVLRAASGPATLRTGVGTWDNPFLAGKDNRGLPPTFRGTSLTVVTAAAHLELAVVDAVLPRGASSTTGLSTTYGLTPVRDVAVAGVRTSSGEPWEGSLYWSRARDLWSQLYASWSATGDVGRGMKLGLALAGYVTRDSGRALQGRTRTSAWSIALTPGGSWGELMIGLQRVNGEQFLDFIAETAGPALANVYSVDFNAPQERSRLVALTLREPLGGFPGSRLILWHGRGWGADASAEAARHAATLDPLRALYWKNEQPISGSHREYGLLFEAPLDDMGWKGVRLRLIGLRHLSAQHYAEYPFREFILKVERSM